MNNEKTRHTAMNETSVKIVLAESEHNEIAFVVKLDHKYSSGCNQLFTAGTIEEACDRAKELLQGMVDDQGVPEENEEEQVNQME